MEFARTVLKVGLNHPKSLDYERLIKNRKRPTRSHRTCPKGPMRILAAACLMEQVYQGETRTPR